MSQEPLNSVHHTDHRRLNGIVLEVTLLQKRQCPLCPLGVFRQQGPELVLSEGIWLCTPFARTATQAGSVSSRMALLIAHVVWRGKECRGCIENDLHMTAVPPVSCFKGF